MIRHCSTPSWPCSISVNWKGGPYLPESWDVWLHCSKLPVISLYLNAVNYSRETNSPPTLRRKHWTTDVVKMVLCNSRFWETTTVRTKVLMRCRSSSRRSSRSPVHLWRITSSTCLMKWPCWLLLTLWAARFLPWKVRHQFFFVHCIRLRERSNTQKTHNFIVKMQYLFLALKCSCNNV